MTQDETRNKTAQYVGWIKLRQLMEAYPDARIITAANEDESLMGEELELLDVIWHGRRHTIELVFG